MSHVFAITVPHMFLQKLHVSCDICIPRCPFVTESSNKYPISAKLTESDQNNCETYEALNNQLMGRYFSYKTKTIR